MVAKVESHESTRQRAESLQPKTHDDRIAGERIYFDDTPWFCAQVSPNATSDEDSGCNGCRGQGMEKARDNSNLGLGEKSRTKRKFFWEARRDKQISTLLHWWTYVTSKNAELEPKQQKYWSRMVFREDIVKATLEPVQFLLNQARLRPRCLPQKSWVLLRYCQVRWTCSWCSIFGRCMDTFFFDTHGRNHSGKIEDPVVFLERILHCHPLSGLVRKRQFEQALWELGWETVPNWNVCLFIGNMGLFLSVHVEMTLRWLERSRLWFPCGRNWWIM